MVLIRINPTKILVGGDKIKAENFIGAAKSQMDILLHSMSFQKLNQGIRRVWLHENVFVECIKCFNYQECKIWVKPEELLGRESTLVFLVVFATDSGKEAIVWDLISNAPVSEKIELDEIEERLLEIDEEFTSLIEAVCPMTDNHIWDIDYPSERYDTPLILPDFLYGWFAQDGYFYVFTHLYPAYYTARFDGLVDTVEWDLDYIPESPLPHINKDVLSETAPQQEDAEQSSYITFFQGRVDGDSPLVSEFEDLTGKDFPEGTGDNVFRLFQFWHPFFWYTNKDTSGDLAVISADGRGILLADSWADGEWIGEGDSLELSKDSLTWQTSGIATNTETSDGDPQILLFEYVSVCHKFEDTYYSGMCDLSICEFDQYFRMYEHGSVPKSGIKKQILDLTNAERETDLVFNSALSNSAQRHANDQAEAIGMGGLAAFSILDGHTGTDGTLPPERMFDAGYYKWIEDDVENVKNNTTLWGVKVAENTGLTYADDMAENFIEMCRNSPEHWAALTDEDFVELGIGVAKTQDGGFIIVQNFGKVDHRYPGFSPFDTDSLKTYVDENFLFDPDHEPNRVPKMYLIGRMDLTVEQLELLTQESEND